MDKQLNTIRPLANVPNLGYTGRSTVVFVTVIFLNITSKMVLIIQLQVGVLQGAF